jgi:4-amino-4-deoxy-L-arabinose transferase-like glycosyltransferase
VAFGGLALLSAGLRAAAFLRYRFDSDEPQHLHVAWGWTAGLVQYRDLFDNHAPLFHILMAPILRVVGERPDVLLYMRAPMLVLFAVVIWGTYVLGRRMYSARVGAWAALLLSLYPTFFLKSIEFRTDNLWNTLWVVALLLVTSKLPLRLFLTGVVLGLAFCVSLKTSLLVITLGLSGAIVYGLAMRRRSAGWFAAIVLPVAGGAVIAPAIIAWWFRANGAWASLVYCVFQFNELLINTFPTIKIWAPRLIFLPAMALLLRRAWKRREGRDGEPQALWRYFFAISIGVFIITLVSFWVLISPRDLLPMMPVAAIFFVAWIDRQKRRLTLATLACLACVPLIVAYTDEFHNATLEHVTMMRQVLRLTRPGEPLMDLKGETVYRRRPYYYIFEFITRRELEAGMIPDTIEADVIRAQCHVAQADGQFLPAHGRAFLNANFLDMGRLRAAGQSIGDDGMFTIAIPGEYVVVTRDGIAAGAVDGGPNAPRVLSPGPHRFDRAHAGERVAVLWAPAFARGFSPFHLQDRDF